MVRVRLKWSFIADGFMVLVTFDTPFPNRAFRAGKMAVGRCPSLVFRTQVKEPGVAADVCNPSTREVRSGGPLGLPAGSTA